MLFEHETAQQLIIWNLIFLCIYYLLIETVFFCYDDWYSFTLTCYKLWLVFTHRILWFVGKTRRLVVPGKEASSRWDQEKQNFWFRQLYVLAFPISVLLFWFDNSPNCSLVMLWLLWTVPYSYNAVIMFEQSQVFLLLIFSLFILFVPVS